MPAQIAGAVTEYYVEYDTAPALRRQLRDTDGTVIDLTGAGVTISIAFTMPRGTYYDSPRDQIVLKSPCVVDPDQVANMGWVAWTPGAKGTDYALTPPGEFLYTFQITFPDNTVQTVPSVTYETMVIRTPVGGRSFNDPLPPQPPQPTNQPPNI